MGTNYYLRRDICPHCKRPAEIIHVGKFSAGWSFSFHGTDHIRTFAQWKEQIDKLGNLLFDEYGAVVKPEDFYEMVDAHRLDQNHAERYGGWVDPDGHSFSEGEFS